jgi:hypothetical protein
LVALVACAAGVYTCLAASDILFGVSDNNRPVLCNALFQLTMDELMRLPVRQRIGSVADVCGADNGLYCPRRGLYGGSVLVTAQCCKPFYRLLVEHLVADWCVENKSTIHKEPFVSLCSFAETMHRIKLYVSKDGVLTPEGESLAAFYTIKDL